MSCNRLIVRSAAAVCFVLTFTAGTLAQNVVNDHTAQGASGRKVPSNQGIFSPNPRAPGDAWCIDTTPDVLYSVDKTTGGTTPIGSTSPASAPAGLAWDGTAMYTVDLSGGALMTIDLTTGMPTTVGQTGLSGWQGIASDPTDGGQLYGITQDDQLWRIDRNGGQTTLVGSGVGGLITALEFDANGQLWGFEFSAGDLVRIDKTNGAVTFVGSGLNGFQGLTFDSDGTAYAANTNDDSLYRVNLATGAVTVIGSMGTDFVKALGLEVGSNCPADCDGDGGLNTLDFLCFLNAFTNGDPYADYNGDGTINTLDFLAYLNDFNAGCE